MMAIAAVLVGMLPSSYGSEQRFAGFHCSAVKLVVI